MNRITKNTSIEKDYEILKTATDIFVEAYLNSKQILSGCAVGQAHRGYHSAVEKDLKLYKKLTKIWEQLKQKYEFYHDEIENVSDVPTFFKDKFNIIGNQYAK